MLQWSFRGRCIRDSTQGLMLARLFRIKDDGDLLLDFHDAQLMFSKHKALLPSTPYEFNFN